MKLKPRFTLRVLLLLVLFAAGGIVALDRLLVSEISRGGTQLLTFVVVDIEDGLPVPQTVAYTGTESIAATSQGLILDVVEYAYTDFKSTLREWRVYKAGPTLNFTAPGYQPVIVDINELQTDEVGEPPIGLSVVVCLSDSEDRDGYAFRPNNLDRPLQKVVQEGRSLIESGLLQAPK
ncbi:MAG: hypothetical protein AAFX06_30850 [Planctomycetota bacterium]